MTRLVGRVSIDELLAGTTAACVDALRPYADLDWKATRAADLTWSCWDTALHVADDLYFYAAQLVYRDVDGHVPTELALDDSATVPRLLDMISVHSILLEHTVLAADPADRAYHVYGVSDASGFAAMGVTETLVHTYDLVRGLDPGSGWTPPAAPAAAVLHRLFPDAPTGDPSTTLLHCCGRVSLHGRPRRTVWRWDGTVR